MASFVPLQPLCHIIQRTETEIVSQHSLSPSKMSLVCPTPEWQCHPRAHPSIPISRSRTSAKNRETVASFRPPLPFRTTDMWCPPSENEGNNLFSKRRRHAVWTAERGCRQPAGANWGRLARSSHSHARWFSVQNMPRHTTEVSTSHSLLPVAAALMSAEVGVEVVCVNSQIRFLPAPITDTEGGKREKRQHCADLFFLYSWPKCRGWRGGGGGGEHKNQPLRSVSTGGQGNN